MIIIKWLLPHTILREMRSLDLRRVYSRGAPLSSELEEVWFQTALNSKAHQPFYTFCLCGLFLCITFIFDLSRMELELELNPPTLRLRCWSSHVFVMDIHISTMCENLLVNLSIFQPVKMTNMNCEKVYSDVQETWRGRVNAWFGSLPWNLCCSCVQHEKVKLDKMIGVWVVKV